MAWAIFGSNPKILLSAHRQAFSSKSFMPANKEETGFPYRVGKPVFLFFIKTFSVFIKVSFFFIIQSSDYEQRVTIRTELVIFFESDFVRLHYIFISAESSY